MNGKARLVIEGRGNWVFTHPLGDRPVTVIGRGNDADIRLDDLHASSRHVEIVREGEEFIIRDLKSRNGTYVGGKKVEEGRLKNGAQIRIGNTTMSFLSGEDESFCMSSSGIEAIAQAPAPESALETMMERLETLKVKLVEKKTPMQSMELLETEIDTLQEDLRSARETIRRLTIAKDFDRIISLSSDPLELVSTALDFMAKGIQAENGFIMQIDPQAKKWVVRAKYGMIQDWVRVEGDEKAPLPLSLTIVEQVVRTGEPVISKSALDDPRFDSSKSIAELNILSFLCLPMKQADKTVGVVYVDRRNKIHPFTNDDEKLFTDLTGQLNRILYPSAPVPGGV